MLFRSWLCQQKALEEHGLLVMNGLGVGESMRDTAVLQTSLVLLPALSIATDTISFHSGNLTKAECNQGGGRVSLNLGDLECVCENSSVSTGRL